MRAARVCVYGRQPTERIHTHIHTIQSGYTDQPSATWLLSLASCALDHSLQRPGGEWCRVQVVTEGQQLVAHTHRAGSLQGRHGTLLPVLVFLCTYGIPVSCTVCEARGGEGEREEVFLLCIAAGFSRPRVQAAIDLFYPSNPHV
uniref:Uncharacterized protein n=1 Tax=Vitrella brassicaformis TaxID=1169539 RepID=A0A7S1JN70_9ALVE|mmetsp:Transcript_16527/g.39677  ORF Transcript_16527/g.39677 Transcript_16527/m.39677 type:complete len:145 (+) Transcript_16527:53-487(+)